MLPAGSGTSDAIDATVVYVAADGDDILTSDPGDLHALAQAAEIHVDLIPVQARIRTPALHAWATVRDPSGCPEGSSG